MKLENSFTIDAPVDKAWEALNSPETVAPCFPGATLTSYEGDSFSGTVKVKLGPIAMTYKGKGTYVTRDEAAREVVIDATGRDSRGNGTASAKVTASLAADGPDKTAVTMVTDMTITGKPAQFGRGVIADVADKIIGQFSACVARKLAPEEQGASEADAPAADVSSSSPATSAGSPTTASSASAASSTASVASAGSGKAAPVSEAEAPAADMSPSSGGPRSGGPGASEADAPATDMTSASPATSVGSGSASGAGTAATNGTSAAAPAAVSSAASASAPASPLRSAQAPIRSEVEAIDLFDTAGAPVLKRLAPAAGVGVFLLLVFLLVRRLRSS